MLLYLYKVMTVTSFTTSYLLQIIIKTMELFYDVGENCSLPTCKRLDFLPFACGLCNKSYCRDHRDFTHHVGCPGIAQNRQAPVCPLCKQVVPGASSSSERNAAIDHHIEQGCPSPQAETNRRKKANRCAIEGCRKSELVPLKCSRCNKIHCIRHRNHACGAPLVLREAGKGIMVMG